MQWIANDPEPRCYLGLPGQQVILRHGTPAHDKRNVYCSRYESDRMRFVSDDDWTTAPGLANILRFAVDLLPTRNTATMRAHYSTTVLKSSSPNTTCLVYCCIDNIL